MTAIGKAGRQPSSLCHLRIRLRRSRRAVYGRMRLIAPSFGERRGNVSGTISISREVVRNTSRDQHRTNRRRDDDGLQRRYSFQELPVGIMSSCQRQEL